MSKFIMSIDKVINAKHYDDPILERLRKATKNVELPVDTSSSISHSGRWIHIMYLGDDPEIKRLCECK